MAKATAAPAQVEETEPAERDYEAFSTKGPTALHVALTDWILDKTGYDPSTAKTKAEAFARGVSLGAYLRMDHQSSDENRAWREARAAEKEAAAQARAAQQTMEVKPATTPTGEPKAEAPKRRPTKAAAAAAAAAPSEPVKAAPRRRPAKAAAGTAPAPF